MNLEGRVALVTGAARRVGRAIALRLAGAGCRVAAHYHDSESDAGRLVEEIQRAGGDAGAFQADLAQADAPARLVEETLRRFGRLDILVNNAAVFEKMRLDQFELEAWDRTLRVNLTAPMALAFAARAALRASRGRILNLCDVATRRPWPDHLAYIVSKAGLETLTAALARAFAPDVNVVGIAPGVALWPESYDHPTRERLLARVPLARAGTPADIAAAAHFLLAEADYVTGVVLPVDGGRSVV